MIRNYVNWEEISQEIKLQLENHIILKPLNKLTGKSIILSSIDEMPDFQTNHYFIKQIQMSSIEPINVSLFIALEEETIEIFKGKIIGKFVFDFNSLVLVSNNNFVLKADKEGLIINLHCIDANAMGKE